MRTSYRMWLAGWLTGLIVLSGTSIAVPSRSAFPRPQAAGASAVPVVDDAAGSCTADFVVKDPSGKGIYNAKINIQLRYGFMGLHRIDATVGTNSDGKARIEGLPEQIKKTAEFTISHGDQTKSFPYDPLTDCHPHHEVTLAEK